MVERKVYFNAPAMTRADTVVAPGRYERAGNKVTDKLKNWTRSEIISRKGWLTPDTTYDEDWEGNVDTEPEDIDGEPPGRSYTYNNPNSRSTTETVEGDPRSEPVNLSTLFPNNEQYGFRFMYNPPEIGFTLAQTAGLNVPFIMSGQEKAVAVVPTGSTITMRLTISRIDDLAVIQGLNPQNPEGAIADLAGIQKLYDFGGREGIGAVTEGEGWPQEPGRKVKNLVTPGSQSKSLTLDILAEKRVKIDQIREIAKMGTMHDLNYLFRAFTARNWMTAYRDVTADVGLMFSVPLVLDLGNPNLRYRVRLVDVQYTHRMFTPTMIPTLTDLALVFDRLPDIVNWDITPGAATPSLADRQ